MGEIIVALAVCKGSTFISFSSCQDLLCRDFLSGKSFLDKKYFICYKDEKYLSY